MISAGYKVHPLWQSYEVLLLFSVMTAFIMRVSIVIFEGEIVQAGLKGNGPDEKDLFVKLTNTIRVLLAIFVVLRFGELIYCDKLSYAFVGDLYSVMFWIEVVLMVFPFVELRMEKLRNDFRVLYLFGAERAVGLRDVASELFAGGTQPRWRLPLLPDLGRTDDFYWFCGY